MKSLFPKILALALASFVASASDEIKIRGTAFANWWELGDAASFKIESGKLPSDVARIDAEVFDSSNSSAFKSSIDANAFASGGFSWMPSQPGLYSVEFSLVGPDGKARKIEESVDVKIRENGGKFQLKAEKAFKYAKHYFAILPRKARAPKDCPPIIGASVGWNPGNKANVERELDACLLLGLNFIRLQPLYWAKLEKERGKFDWSEPDWWIEGAERRGFGLVVNPWGTPKWAASDQSTAVKFLFPGYMQSMPAKIEYWTDFLKAAMDRYPRVRQWQLWNEAGLPGQSCFWNGTPEQYLELLKSGYETIKAQEPDAVVWDGCPLAELYAVDMKKGEAKYFDTLDLHGKWIGQKKAMPGRHDETEKAVGVKKPWGSLEWHAILNSASDQRLSEETLTRNMLLDLMDMIRNGAELAAVHCVFNGSEMETLDFSRDNGNGWAHAAGLFRKKPAIEPRLPGVALRNFTDLFSGKIEYLDGYALPGGLQCAGLLKSASGHVLAFWQSGKTPLKIAPELLNAAGPDSVLVDWEGRELKPEKGLLLTPDRVYMLRNPDLKTIANWSFKAQVLRKSSATTELDESVCGLYRAGKLFDKAMNVMAPEKIRWLDVPKYVSVKKGVERKFLDGAGRPEGFAARFAAALDEDGLDLMVEVKDRKQYQNSRDKALYEGDSVQIAFDTQGKGAMEHRLELTAALTSKGAIIWKQKAADSDGLVLERCTQEGNPLKYARAEVERKGDITLYKLRIDKEELYPFKPSPGAPLRLSLLVNDNDGEGREGWLEWASGIGKFKAPELYGTLSVDPGEGKAVGQERLRLKQWDAKLDFASGSVKVSCLPEGKGNAGVGASVETVPGARYKVSFKARGDAMVEGMAVAARKEDPKWERVDFLKPRIQLNGEWQTVERSFTAPLKPAKISVWIFLWKQKERFFEIKDFKFEAEATR